MRRHQRSQITLKPGRCVSYCVSSWANSTRHGSCSENGYRLIGRSMTNTSHASMPTVSPHLIISIVIGGGSPLTNIRSKVAFHYSDDDDLIEQSFQAVADTEPLELYLTNEVGNSFYHASEVIVMQTAIRMAVSGGDAAAFSELCLIVIKVSRDITELFGQLMGVILKTYMPDLERQIENHPDGPKISTLSLPYFIDLER